MEAEAIMKIILIAGWVVITIALLVVLPDLIRLMIGNAYVEHTQPTDEENPDDALVKLGWVPDPDDVPDMIICDYCGNTGVCGDRIIDTESKEEFALCINCKEQLIPKDLKHIRLKRNSRCWCGSGKKYKRCCGVS